MTAQIGQGGTIRLDSTWTDGAGTLVNPTMPRATIINPSSISVVVNAVPSSITTGLFYYDFAVPAGAPLGTWTIHWAGTVNGALVSAYEAFTVVRAGSVGFPGHRGQASTCAPWATVADLCAPCNTYEADLTTLETWLQVASDALYNLTGRRWPGECERVERPCGGGCFNGLPLAPNTPPSLIGALRSSPWPYRDQRSSCSCSALSRVRLEAEPVTGIVEVLVDGAIVPPGEYQIDNGRWLTGRRKADGTLRVWPVCQYLELADTEVGTWSVRYRYGASPPPGGVASAASLGCQLALSCQPEALKDGRCRLPKRVTTITRQGVTLAVLDSFALFKDGLTGLAEVDLWLSSVRYGDKGRRATMSDPARRR